MSIQLEFTKEIEKNTASIYQKIRSVLPEVEWPLYAPYIYKINKLKKKQVFQELILIKIKQIWCKKQKKQLLGNLIFMAS